MLRAAFYLVSLMTSTQETSMGRCIYLGTAKPDDPIYREGYSIHIGPLLGTEPPQKPSQAEPKPTATNLDQDKRKRPRRRS